METIITLLIVLLPVVFKLIGKSLEKAAKSPDASLKRVVPETDEPEFAETVYEQIVDRRVEQVETQQAVTEDKPKNKLDPKKLIVYSEIMKPKF